MSNRMSDKIQTLWIEVTTRCNLKCEWCYNQYRNDGKDMSFELFKEYLRSAIDIGIKNVVIVGGEPFLWPHIQDAIKLISTLSISSTIITNGTVMVEKDVQMITDNIGLLISIKSTHPSFMIKHAGGYYDLSEKISLINRLGIKYSINIMISSLNTENIVDDIRNTHRMGASKFYLSFCRPAECKNSFIDHSLSSKTASNFVKKNYEYIDSITGGHVSFFVNYPLCEWNFPLIDTLVRKKQIMTVCTVLTRNGIFIDLDNKVKMCNNMPKLALLESNGNLIDTLEVLHNDMQIKKKYELILSTPIDCESCEMFQYCGGGCPLLRRNNVVSFIDKPLHGLGTIDIEIKTEQNSYQCMH